MSATRTARRSFTILDARDLVHRATRAVGVDRVRSIVRDTLDRPSLGSAAVSAPWRPTRAQVNDHAREQRKVAAMTAAARRHGWRVVSSAISKHLGYMTDDIMTAMHSPRRTDRRAASLRCRAAVAQENDSRAQFVRDLATLERRRGSAYVSRFLRSQKIAADNRMIAFFRRLAAAKDVTPFLPSVVTV